MWRVYEKGLCIVSIKWRNFLVLLRSNRHYCRTCKKFRSSPYNGMCSECMEAACMAE